MNIPPSEAERLSLQRYEGLLWHWNDARAPNEVDAPDPEIAIPLLDRINADPRLTGAAPAKQMAN